MTVVSECHFVTKLSWTQKNKVKHVISVSIMCVCNYQFVNVLSWEAMSLIQGLWALVLLKLSKAGGKGKKCSFVK